MMPKIRARAYSYLIDDSSEGKKVKGKKKVHYKKKTCIRKF